jgi:imidazoleglycerol phosphate synthase glutamine amidotransferase subunit HisH
VEALPQIVLIDYGMGDRAARCAAAAVVAGVTNHGGGDHAAAVARDAVWAIQFHPQRSSSVGLLLLANFMALVRKERAK